MSKLFDQLTSDTTLTTAWEKVRSNAGAAGVDQITVRHFEENVNEKLIILKTSLIDGSYQPLPLKTFRINKEDGRKRTLHIPTVRDRIVAQALVMVIQPIYEKIFHNCSYAYRPGLSSKKALDRVERNLKRGRVWVLNLDIMDFFDSVNRALLMNLLEQEIADKNIQKIVRLLIDSFENETNSGIAQGLPLSPLLSNIYLHPLDDRLVRAQWNYIRYSDNILVLDKEESQINKAFDWIKEEMEKLDLTWSEEKTAIVHLKSGFSFLGFHFNEKGKQPDRPAFERLDKRIGSLLGKAFQYTDAQMKSKLEAILRGWLNYFDINADDKKEILAQVDQNIPGDDNALPRKIIKVVLAYQLGDEESARNELKAEDIMTSQDARLNFQWGIICDILGFQNEARDSYLAAFRQEPNDPETAFQIGLYYLKRNQHDQAIRYLQKSVQLDSETALYQFTLGIALKNYSLHGAAGKALKKAYDLEPSLRHILDKTPKPSDNDERYKKFSDNDIDLFLRLFNGREGVHAIQWLNDDGRTGYSSVKNRISPSDIKAHWQGGITLGMYLMRMDNTVSHLVFDIDVTRQARSLISDEENLHEWQEFVLNDVHLVRSVLNDLGIHAVAEDSGYKGAHLWVFFNEPQPARRIINFARKVIQKAGPPPTGLHREIFPNQPSVSEKALGPLVKIPMGLHKLTQKRCEFLNETGQPVNSPFDFIKKIKAVTTKELLTAFEKTRSTARLDKTKIKKQDSEKLDKIFNGCNVLAYLQEKAIKEHQLSHMDRLTLLCVISFLGEAGRQKLHEIISNSTNYDFKITERWYQRKRGYPVSCPKIRIWQSNITPAVGCYCKFKENPGNYPSPLLHADENYISKLKKKINKELKQNKSIKDSPKQSQDYAEPKANNTEKDKHETRSNDKIVENNKSQLNNKESNNGSGVQKEILEDIVEKYLKLLTKKRNIERQLLQIEEKLDQIATDNGGDTIETKMGKLIKKTENGKTKWLLEL